MEPHDLPASIIQSAALDPASGTAAPQNFGQPVLEHIHTAAGRYGVASHAYLNMDEALRDSRANAERMRADCGIMECIEQRQRAVALLPWHIEAEDDKNPEHKDLAAKLTAILEETPRFTEYRRCLQEAIWYGRYAVANQFGPELIGGKWRTAVRRWEPRHGDKLIFRFDDGSRSHLADQVGIRVSAAFKKNWHNLYGPNSQRRSQVQPTEMGMVYWLNRWERETVVVHKHMVEDGPFEDPRMAGRIHGIGARDRIYWTWYAMVECLQRVVEYLDRAAFGVEVWPYPAGNPKAKQATEAAAHAQLSGGRTVILAPINPVEDPEVFMPRIIEPGLGGVAQTIDIIKTYFFHRIKRYILGQTLSSEADATGLGSGVADAHLATLADILTYDARNQEETITKELLRPVQHWNFRGSQSIKLKFKIDTESDNVLEKLQSLTQAWSMGLRIKADEVYRIVGTAKPDQDDEMLLNPQIGNAAAAAGGIQPGNGGAVVSLENFHHAFAAEMQRRGLAA